MNLSENIRIHLVALVAVFSLAVSTVNAQSIVSYDIDDAALSGFGGWSHLYDGSITTTGAFSAEGFAYTRGDYSGGSGTLNDGFAGNGVLDTQLFVMNDDAAPVITIYLDSIYTIDSLFLSGFDSGNSIPGQLLGWDLTINGITETFLSDNPTSVDESIDLAGSSLDGLAADQIILSNFSILGDNGLPSFFAIGEITVTGTAVPEPTSTLVLVGLGLAVIRRRNRRS